MVDVAGFFVEDRFRIAVVADRRVDRLPDVELLAGAAVRAQRQLVLVGLLRGGQDVSQIVAHARLHHFRCAPSR